MFKGDGGDDGPEYAGFASQTEPEGIKLPIDPQMAIPMPARTPDWPQVGAPVVFLEGMVDQIAAIIADPAFISFIETNAELGPGEYVDIQIFEFGLDWIVNSSHAGLNAFESLEMTQTQNDSENLEMITFDVDAMTYEEYFWNIDGTFATAASNMDLYLDISVESYAIGPGPTTTTTTTTTTDDTAELTPGFEVVFAIGSLIALPLFLRKRR